MTIGSNRYSCLSYRSIQKYRSSLKPSHLVLLPMILQDRVSIQRVKCNGWIIREGRKRASCSSLQRSANSRQSSSYDIYSSASTATIFDVYMDFREDREREELGCRAPERFSRCVMISCFLYVSSRLHSEGGGVDVEVPAQRPMRDTTDSSNLSTH